jgi:hypothetical protein
MRRSHIVAATILAAALVTAATASAQARLEAPVKPATPQFAPGLSSKPYSRLFDQRLSQARSALQFQMRSMTPNSARRFICSTPVLPADSALDPKFEMRPRDTTTRFSMRVVAPGQCH